MPDLNKDSRELKVQLRGNVLRISDTSLYFDSGIEVELPSGEYGITEVADESGEPLGLDVRARGEFDQVETVGEILFSFGQFGLFDKSEVDRCFDQMDDMDQYFVQLQSEDQRGSIELPNGVQVPFFRCAEGAAMISRLLQRNKPVGVQIRYGHLDDVEDD